MARTVVLRHNFKFASENMYYSVLYHIILVTVQLIPFNHATTAMVTAR
jgi:hypothetical protein